MKWSFFILFFFSISNFFFYGEKKFDLKLASNLSSLALSCIDREYPNKPADVLNSPEDVEITKNKHPVFFGCFDYHSSVHGHWMLLKIAKLFPDSSLSKRIYERLDAHFTEGKLLKEADYFKNPYTKSFERPYGWGWLLRLILEVKKGPQNKYAKKWEKYFTPLERVIVDRFVYYLNNLKFPIRSSEHSNTAFALSNAYDYAVYVGNKKLKNLIEKRARDFYYSDENYPIEYEPDGEAFLSPALTEADLMCRILSRNEFNSWFKKFLPFEKIKRCKNFNQPVSVSNKNDPKMIHMDGLNLSKAWAFKDIYKIVDDRAEREFLYNCYLKHREYGLRNVMSGNYGGEHWLASFAIYLLTVEPEK